MHGFGQVSDVLACDSGNGDSAVSGQVDVEVVLELVDLLRGEARVAEHSDLVSDVAPVPL